MKLVAPDYYPLFRCKAGACRHTCCVGWEIDIDRASLDRYRRVPGAMGQRLHRNIDWENACFRLDEGERCPFLNASGLCDLILTLGEDSLCQICADHPRFRNFLAGRTEIGLGLCCQAAAELVLARQEPMSLLTLEDGPENGADAPFLAFRDRLLALAQNRQRPVESRVQDIQAACGIHLAVDAPGWATFLLALERLDPAWEGCLRRLMEPPGPAPGWEIPLEQLLCYLLYRHLAEEDVLTRVAYCCLVWQLLRHMLRDDLPSLARMYSSEIEYSDENLDAMLDRVDSLLQAAGEKRC